MLIRVRVNSARNIPKMDMATETDAFCKLNLLRVSRFEKTRVIGNCPTPVWNEEFVFDITSYDTDILHIQMFDKDVVFDDAMGIVNIAVKQLTPGRVVRSWYNLEPVSRCKQPGEIDLTLQVAQSGSGPWIDSPFTPEVLVVTILEGAKLPALDTDSESDPYAVLCLEGSPRKYRTKVMDNNSAPVWNENVEFLITSRETDVLIVIVFDKDILNDDTIGKAEVPIEILSDGTLRDMWFQLKPPKGKKAAGEIRLKVQLRAAPPVIPLVEEPGKIKSCDIPKY
jgi:Ca2+-dependent lipid-binding protein